MATRVFKELRDGKGRKVILRTPTWDDLDDFLELINSAVEERVDIYADEKKTRFEEADWLGRNLTMIEKGERVQVLAEVDGKVVGTSVLEPRHRSMSHVAELGILVKGGYRNAGIGTAMLRTLVEEAKRLGFEILIIKYFSGNHHARHVYEKIGFVETGREPDVVKRDGRYRDLVTMAMKLRST